MEVIMKNFKFALIFTALATTCTPNFAAMPAPKTEVVPAKKVATKKAPEVKEAINLETINKRLSQYTISGGHVQIKEVHQAYADMLPDFDGEYIGRQLNLAFVREDKEANIGIRQYKIRPTTKTVYLDNLEIDEPYRRYGFGTLLIIAALLDEIIMQHACTKAIVTATNTGIQALYRKISFVNIEGSRDFVRDDLQDYIQIQTPALLEAFFETFAKKILQKNS